MNTENVINQKAKVKNIILFTPSLTGGGAEKVFLLIAKYLSLSSIEVNQIIVIVQDIFYEQSRKVIMECTNHSEKIIIKSLPSSKIFALLDIIKLIILKKNISSFLLNLQMVSYAPIIKILKPKSIVVSRIGNTLTSEYSKIDNIWLRNKYLVACYFGLIFADKIVAQCKYMKEDILAFMPFIKPEKISTIYNACESEVYKLAKLKNDCIISKPYIFCASSYKPQKRLDFLLESFSKIIQNIPHTLVIAGIQDSHSNNMSETINKLNLQKQVILLPYVNNIYPLINSADICVLASEYEGFSNFLLESVSLGKVTLAMDCPGGNKELSKMTNLLLLSKANTPDQFSQDIMNALNSSQNKLTMLRESTQELPNIFNMCEQYLKLLLD
jgi:glycosyltransferase involved in cell wall biosynthesis